eukprot:2698261-Amphidinium_carterae.1
MADDPPTEEIEERTLYPEYNPMYGAVPVQTPNALVKWCVAPGDGNCGWHSCCQLHNGTFEEDQFLDMESYKTTTLTRLAARTPQLSVLWGVEPEVVQEILAVHRPPGAWLDTRVLMALAYLYDVAIAIFDQPQSCVRLLQTATVYRGDHRLWCLRFTPDHYSPGFPRDLGTLQAVLSTIPLKPWSTKAVPLLPGGGFVPGIDGVSYVCSFSHIQRNSGNFTPEVSPFEFERELIDRFQEHLDASCEVPPLEDSSLGAQPLCIVEQLTQLDSDYGFSHVGAGSEYGE